MFSAKAANAGEIEHLLAAGVTAFKCMSENTLFLFTL
jgi:hypothetical protein